MEQRLNVVTLVVTDLDDSRRFYRDALGWRPLIDVPGEVLMFEVGTKLVLSLWAEERAVDEIGPVVRGGTAPVTLAHNCGSPEDVDRVLEDARAAGAQVQPGVRRDWGGYSGYFADPDGFRWEVAHAPEGVGGLTFP
ncbi:VOC family protein [Nocardioides terrisoli]|uniref:VOC family protein n=1 Tax=Nocardioides terrisoli TaxID=3388267 RepID=UPI00287BB4AF|nr:VOC family protein [Nocardioides marmorisolisilvae]